MKNHNLIVCAAMLMDDGLVVTGVRHYSPDMCATLRRIYGDEYHKKVKKQGFIDIRGQFLDRSSAWQRAQQTNQIRHRCGDVFNHLFSENLY